MTHFVQLPMQSRQLRALRCCGARLCRALHSVFPLLANSMGPVLGTRRWLLVDKLEPDMLYRTAVMHELTFMAVQAAKAAGTTLRADLFFSARLRVVSRRSARVRRLTET